MTFKDIFVSKARQLFWQRLPASQVAEGYTEIDIKNDEAYFIIRLKEMYIRNIRVLWRKFYPMLHSYVELKGKECHNVAGPGQLRELGEANLERIVNLNTRLTDLIAYKGGDVDMLLGLYSVPGQDAARVLIDTLNTVANLGGLALSQSLAIADTIKTGVESIVGMNEARLELGVRDSFYTSNPFRSGYYLAVNAQAASVDVSKLWLSNGRLVKGPAPQQAAPYEDCDYMLVEIEPRLKREDWPSLPELGKINQIFGQIMRDTTLKPLEKRARLADQWPTFTEALNESPDLIRPDREFIAQSTFVELDIRLKAMETGNPFEPRGWGSKLIEPGKPEEFDLAYVPDVSIAAAAPDLGGKPAALVGNPFLD